jgi:ACS family hexuronate transporter-like MFS transporter
MYLVIGLIALATAAHQGWSANMYAIAGNLFPKNVVASVTGIGGMAGALGGVLLAFITGYLINWFGYASMFIIASGAYIVALLIIHLILPKLKPVDL